MAITTGDTVTFEYTARLEDGTVFDTSDESLAEEADLAEDYPDRSFEPLTVELGNRQIIEGLEEALLGLEKGAEDTVTIPPEKAYGSWDEQRVQEFDADQFGGENVLGDEIEEGDHLESQNGQVGKITDIGDEVVRIDFNHDLAGETLEFEFKITDVE